MLASGHFRPWGVLQRLALCYAATAFVVLKIPEKYWLCLGNGIPFDPEGLLSTFPAIVNCLAGYQTACYLQRHPASGPALLRLGMLLAPAGLGHWVCAHLLGTVLRPVPPRPVSEIVNVLFFKE